MVAMPKQCDQCTGENAGKAPVRIDYAEGTFHCACCDRILGSFRRIRRADEAQPERCYTLVDHMAPGLVEEQVALEERALCNQLAARASGWGDIPFLVFARQLSREWWAANPRKAPDFLPYV